MAYPLVQQHLQGEATEDVRHNAVQRETRCNDQRADVEIIHHIAVVVGVSNVLNVAPRRHCSWAGSIVGRHAAGHDQQAYFLASSPLTFSHSLSVLT